MKIGAYTLELTCDKCGREESFVTHRRAASRRAAREADWWLGRVYEDDVEDDLCPYCFKIKPAVDKKTGSYGMLENQETNAD